MKLEFQYKSASFRNKVQKMVGRILFEAAVQQKKSFTSTELSLYLMREIDHLTSKRTAMQTQQKSTAILP